VHQADLYSSQALASKAHCPLFGPEGRRKVRSASCEADPYQPLGGLPLRSTWFAWNPSTPGPEEPPWLKAFEYVSSNDYHFQ